MSELRSALDGLADVDLHELSDAALLDLVAELSTAANRVAAALTSAVRAADRRECYRCDGAVSMKAWLRGTCRLAPAEATAVVSTGRRLEQLPETAAAFAMGEVTATHARVITRAVTPGRVAKAAEAGIELGGGRPHPRRRRTPHGAERDGSGGRPLGGGRRPRRDAR